MTMSEHTNKLHSFTEMLAATLLFVAFLSFLLLAAKIAYGTYEMNKAQQRYKEVMEQLAIQRQTYVDENGDFRVGFGHCVECKQKVIMEGFNNISLKETP